MVGRSEAEQGATLMAVLLINTLLTAVRSRDDSGGFDARRPLVLQTVVRQVCCRHACCRLANCISMPCRGRHMYQQSQPGAAGGRLYSGNHRGCSVGTQSNQAVASV